MLWKHFFLFILKFFYITDIPISINAISSISTNEQIKSKC